MKNLVLKELKIHRKLLVIWSVILLLTSAFGGIEFKGLQKSMALLEETVATFPKIVRITFGVDAFPISSAIGSYASMFYWYQMVAFAFALYIGIYFVSMDEHENKVDFLYTKPFKRKYVIIAKIIVAIISNAIISTICAVGTLIFLLPYLGPEEKIVFYIIISTIGMFLTQIIYTSVGVLCSTLTKSYRVGILVGFTILIGSYVLAYIIEFLGNVSYLNILTPVRYFNLIDITEKGLVVHYLIASGVITITCIYIALKKFQDRDLIG